MLGSQQTVAECTLNKQKSNQPKLTALLKHSAAGMLGGLHGPTTAAQPEVLMMTVEI